MKIDLRHLCITADAAMYMDAHKLVMRNSYTKQVQSLHYMLKDFSDTHSAGGGLYCTPLWTVTRPQLLQDIDDKKLRLTDHIDWREVQSIDIRARLDASALLEGFVNRIKQTIESHASFGSHFRHYYDYELLIAMARDYNLDDLGRYRTGGRSHSHINDQTIVYRITLNDCEIRFLKAILNGSWDWKLFHKKDIGNARLSVINTLRINICNQLVTQIITSKLILFLNACGQLKTVNAFSLSDLEVLLEQVLHLHQREHEQILDKQLESYIVLDHYLTAKKWTLSSIDTTGMGPILIPQKKAAVRCGKMILQEYLMAIDQALQTLQDKIGGVSQHACLDAKIKACDLLASLKSARDAFQLGILQPKVDRRQVCDQFKKQCSALINDAIPILEKDLGWGDYLLNLLKILCNAVIMGVTFGHVQGMFTCKSSSSAKEVEVAKIGLRLDCSAP
jgi:hypothetical protein